LYVIQEYAKTACSRILSCGHPCRGIKDEDHCLPCLHRCGKEETLKQDADDMCMICFTEALSAAPAIQVIDKSSQMKSFVVLLHTVFSVIFVDFQFLWIGRNWNFHWHLNSWFWWLLMTSHVIYIFCCALNFVDWLKWKPWKCVFNK
jgi:hypothetical protein